MPAGGPGEAVGAVGVHPGREFGAATGAVLRSTVIATTLGNGDALVNCAGPTDFREVIQTSAGHDIRHFEMPTTTIDSRSVLYAAWNDQPGGIGGPPSTATRIFLSFSRNSDRTWSKPVVISGPVSNRVVTDRFQPWITVGGGARHAMWYERVGNPIQADAENLSLATASAGPHPGPEVRASTVRFPIIQTNPNQDPVINNCYMGDYNSIAFAGGTQYISWGDNRNVVQTTQGTEHQPDVFLAIRHGQRGARHRAALLVRSRVVASGSAPWLGCGRPRPAPPLPVIGCLPGRAGAGCSLRASFLFRALFLGQGFVAGLAALPVRALPGRWLMAGKAA